MCTGCMSCSTSICMEAPCSQRNILSLGCRDSQKLKLLSWDNSVGSQDVSAWERLSSPRSMLGYVIFLNIHKGIDSSSLLHDCCTLTSTTDFRLLGKAPSQLFYSSFQGIQ